MMRDDNSDSRSDFRRPVPYKCLVPGGSEDVMSRGDGAIDTAIPQRASAAHQQRRRRRPDDRRRRRRITGSVRRLPGCGITTVSIVPFDECSNAIVAWRRPLTDPADSPPRPVLPSQTGIFAHLKSSRRRDWRKGRARSPVSDHGSLRAEAVCIGARFQQPPFLIGTAASPERSAHNALVGKGPRFVRARGSLCEIAQPPSDGQMS